MQYLSGCPVGVEIVKDSEFAAVIAASLTLRSLDYAVCPMLPIGTHFLWHTLNGWMLYLLVTAIMTRKVN